MVDYVRNNYSFKLAVMGGVTVEAKVENYVVTELSVSAAQPYSGHIVLPDNRVFEISMCAGDKIIIN